MFCKKYRAFPSGLYVARKLLEIRRLISENGSAVRAPSSKYWRVRRIRGGVALIDRGIKNTVPEILRYGGPCGEIFPVSFSWSPGLYT